MDPTPTAPTATDITTTPTTTVPPAPPPPPPPLPLIILPTPVRPPISLFPPPPFVRLSTDFFFLLFFFSFHSRCCSCCCFVRLFCWLVCGVGSASASARVSCVVCLVSRVLGCGFGFVSVSPVLALPSRVSCIVPVPVLSVVGFWIFGVVSGFLVFVPSHLLAYSSLTRSLSHSLHHSLTPSLTRPLPPSLPRCPSFLYLHHVSCSLPLLALSGTRFFSFFNSFSFSRRLLRLLFPFFLLPSSFTTSHFFPFFLLPPSLFPSFLPSSFRSPSLLHSFPPPHPHETTKPTKNGIRHYNTTHHERTALILIPIPILIVIVINKHMENTPHTENHEIGNHQSQITEQKKTIRYIRKHETRNQKYQKSRN